MSAALRELLAKATPGPWMYQEQSDAYTHIVRADGRRFICQLAQDTSGVAEANARLMAEAINALPALLAKSAEYDALVARVEGQRESFEDNVLDFLWNQRRSGNGGMAYQEAIAFFRAATGLAASSKERPLASDDRPSHTAGDE